MTTPAWIRRYQAARVTLPTWAETTPHRLSYGTNASGVWQLVSWDTTTDRQVTLTDKPTGVLGGQPTPDGAGVVWFDDRAGDEFGRYVRTPFGGGPADALVPGLSDGWSSGLSLRPGRLAVGVSSRDGGFGIHVADDAGVRQVYGHAQPASVGGLSKDAAQLAVSHTEHGDVLHPALRVLDAVSGEPVAEVWDGRGNTVSPAAWSPVAGDPRVAILADRTGRMRPEVLDVGDGARRELVIDLPGEIWVADWWPDASALLLGHDHLGRTELLRYDLDSDRAEPLDLTDGTIRGARVRPDGAIWYAFNSSAKPSQVRVRDADADRALLTPPGQPAPEGRAYTSLHYDNSDGDQVHAFLVTPDGEGPFPLVVDVHGGPTAQTEDSFDPQQQSWVDHGYAVLMPNYRGSSGYGKAFEDVLQGDPGRPELVDVLAGRDHLVAAGIADPDRCVLTGASWGGYVTLQAIGTQPRAWSAAVAVVPVADYVAAYADEAPALQEFDRSLFGGSPDDLPELFRERSPITHVGNVTCPVLIVTGANDTRCPKRQVDNYVAALDALGKVYAYDVFEAGHGSYAVDETIRQQTLALDFLAEHLGTPAAQRDGG
ncbi:prolyl oligopeptidase family serine peptidase [soil metagenome]